MNYFKEFVSNTTAGSGNQFFFDGQPARVGRAFYKINAPGTYEYSFLFSNVLDSTFQGGQQGWCNLICRPWTLRSLRVGCCPGEKIGSDFMEPEGACAVNEGLTLQPVTVGGQSSVTVAPGAFLTTDPITLTFQPGDYLCLELSYEGPMVPYHPENLLPLYNLEGESWVYDRKMPVPGMVGCRRAVRGRIAYLGDSITQGIGCPKNSYLNWCARVAALVGNDYSHWNLGLGYGRALDLASCGAWMYKARQCDMAVVCYGVNDLRRGRTAQELGASLERIVEELQTAGVRVLLQAVPPYPYTDDQCREWYKVNDYIRQELAPKVWRFFDQVPLLTQPGNPKPLYGGHPKAMGCQIWAEGLYDLLKDELE
ncbi:MAG: SGNH/GDSL hydrolase family protein [Clostridia bacterium]|nr:SGNH/GDSL hydrolase family protein [Clostridia bacterium]